MRCRALPPHCFQPGNYPRVTGRASRARLQLDIACILPAEVE
jgi:hypothetical protein